MSDRSHRTSGPLLGLGLAAGLGLAGLGLAGLAIPGLAPGSAGRVVHGEVVLRPPGARLDSADLIVTVEDVTAKDAASRILARRTFANLTHDGGPTTRLSFVLEGLEPVPGHRYQVRVLVDLDHDGRISRGDYRSVRAFPVFDEGGLDPLVVEAELKRE